MYKLCSEISSSFRDMSELVEALNYFNMGKDLSAECEINFKGMFEKMDKTYPLIRVANFAPYVRSNDKDLSFPTENLRMVADYVNLVDGPTKA